MSSFDRTRNPETFSSEPKAAPYLHCRPDAVQVFKETVAKIEAMEEKHPDVFKSLAAVLDERKPHGS